MMALNAYVLHFQFSLLRCEPKIGGFKPFLAKQGDYENENCYIDHIIKE